MQCVDSDEELAIAGDGSTIHRYSSFAQKTTSAVASCTVGGRSIMDAHPRAIKLTMYMEAARTIKRGVVRPWTK